MGEGLPGAAGVPLPSGEVTFLLTDLEGSTALLRGMGEAAYQSLLADLRRIQVEAARKHDGALVHTAGDSCFFAFPTASGAVAASAEMQRGLGERERATEVGAQLRMGLRPSKSTDVVDGPGSVDR